MVVLNLKPLSQSLKPSKPLRGGALVMVEEAVTVVYFVEIVELHESNLRSTCWQLLPSCRPTFYERCDCQEQKQHITYLPILHTISEARCSIMCYASCYLPCIIKYPRSRVAYLIRVWQGCLGITTKLIFKEITCGVVGCRTRVNRLSSTDT